MATKIGTGPDEIPVNGMLRRGAYLDADLPHSGGLQTIQQAPTIASASTIAPTTLITFISGTTTISTITPPQNFLQFGGSLILIPLGASSLSTGGNIASAYAATANEAFLITYDAGTGLWYPASNDSQVNITLSGLLKAIGSVLLNAVIYKSQPVVSAINASATLTVAQLLTLIITTTSATAVTLTLPTGTLTDAGVIASLPAQTGFDWTIINLGSSAGAVTLAAGTNHTLVGSSTIPIGTSAAFQTVKTAANTYVTYRKS